MNNQSLVVVYVAVAMSFAILSSCTKTPTPPAQTEEAEGKRESAYEKIGDLPVWDGVYKMNDLTEHKVCYIVRDSGVNNSIDCMVASDDPTSR